MSGSSLFILNGYAEIGLEGESFFRGISAELEIFIDIESGACDGLIEIISPNGSKAALRGKRNKSRLRAGKVNDAVLNIELVYGRTERGIEIAAFKSPHNRMIFELVCLDYDETAEAIGRIVRIVGRKREYPLIFFQQVVYRLHAVIKLISQAEATIVGKLYSPYALKPDIILISLNGPERMVI